ncbi:hypothetical protein B0H14DRAFT_2580971 [Mycena olivaceomarginata]|nr:hypothetical protein B0H14DRAFT_2580971 [Mycena olivaceomarginata]
MSNSSTSATSSNLFMKRRRAYVACSNCRKRKVKCITPSEVDYNPCTRCAQKGLKCEYFASPDDDVSSAPTPPPQIQPSSRYSEPGWSPQPITPPSAGISEYLNTGSSSKGGRSRGPVPAAGSSGRYPYRPVPPAAMPPPSASSGQWPQQATTHHHSAPAYPAAGNASLQQYPATGPQYYPGTANAGYGSGGYYAQQPYLPQSSGMAAPWPQAT